MDQSIDPLIDPLLLHHNPRISAAVSLVLVILILIVLMLIQCNELVSVDIAHALYAATDQSTSVLAAAIDLELCCRCCCRCRRCHCWRAVAVGVVD